MRKFQFISSFVLKIAALLFMTFDHVGLVLQMAYPYIDWVMILANILRTAGRLALPLFVFMIVEGVMHTKNIKKYFLRLGIMAAIITIVLILLTYVNFGVDVGGLANEGNIFLDLILVALSVFLLKQKNIWLKFFTLLPVGLSFASFFAKCYEFAYPNIDVVWYPNWLYLQYDWFAIILGIGFYLSYVLMDVYKKYAEAKDGINSSIWEVDGNYRFGVSIIQIFFLILISVLYYCFHYMWSSGVFWDYKTQLWAILSGALILLYNGNRGYNAKWFQYGAYIYYPLHLVIIALIYVLIS